MACVAQVRREAAFPALGRIVATPPAHSRGRGRPHGDWRSALLSASPRSPRGAPECRVVLPPVTARHGDGEDTRDVCEALSVADAVARSSVVLGAVQKDDGRTVPGKGLAPRRDSAEVGPDSASFMPRGAVGRTAVAAPLATATASASSPAARPRTKVVAKHFEAPLCSFQELVNAENSPMSIAEALERLREIASGPNFIWDGPHRGGLLDVTFRYILWHPSGSHGDRRTRVSTALSFLERPGRAYVFQPVVPVTSLVVSPRLAFKPMFELDPRSFHTFKVAWRSYMDFGVVDFRMQVGDQLDRWTQRCKAVIEKPLDFTYWLMLMVGSHYREALVERRALSPTESLAEKTPAICVDTFDALSAILAAPERQLLFAGVDPAPAYLQWLRYIAQQFSSGRPGMRTQFESNEFLRLPVMVVYYGRKLRRGKGKADLTWAGNPALVKSYIARFAEDNCCACQIEHAVRLYTQTCAVGKGDAEDCEDWYCWNGLKVCEVGVPMPSTSGSILSPFVSSAPVALLCPVHGLGAPVMAQERAPQRRRASSVSSGRVSACMQQRSSVLEADSEASEEDEEGSMPHWESGSHADFDEQEKRLCFCRRYIPGFEAHAGRGKKRRAHSPGTGSVPQQQEGERQDVVRALVDFELMHSFVAVLSGGLNLAKQIVRVHFSIDRQAYAHLPATAATWEEGVMGWYHEFHRLDVHGRSRYSMLLERVLRGMLGDGYTGGLLTEALDMLRVKAEVREETMLEAETSPERRLARSRGEATRTLNVDPLSGVILRPAKTFQEGFVSCDSSPASPAAAAGDEHAVAPTLMVPAGAAAAALESRGKAPGGKPGRGAMDVMGSIQVWVDLCGSDSILSHRLHFDSFAQWCHSAHLLPFIQRCYRRCGIAGLAPDQSIGRYRHGMSPHDPLVLPTMVDFCYGHCYPFHRILQYFYGGMSRIMCSIDDPREAESDRAALGLIAGQERLNNQCWFQPSPSLSLCDDATPPLRHPSISVIAASRGSLFPGSARGDGAGVAKMLQHASTKNLGGAGGGWARQSSVGSVRLGSSQGRLAADGPLWLSSGSGGARSGSKASTGRREFSRCSSGQATPLRESLSARGPRSAPRALLGAGDLAPEDPFFWFCAPNFSLYTFPAVGLPRIMESAEGLDALVHRYADFVSRAGTPEPPKGTGRGRRRVADGARGQEEAEGKARGAASPPSICICQPTEMSSHVRERWEVGKDLVDECGMLLGDTGFFPGAYGYRFTFEVKTDNVDPFVHASEVPCAQLLYLQHVARRPRARKPPVEESGEVVSESSDSDVEADCHPALKRGLPTFGEPVAQTDRSAARGRARDAEVADTEGTVPQMLPPVAPLLNTTRCSGSGFRMGGQHSHRQRRRSQPDPLQMP